MSRKDDSARPPFSIDLCVRRSGVYRSVRPPCCQFPMDSRRIGYTIRETVVCFMVRSVMDSLSGWNEVFIRENGEFNTYNGWRRDVEKTPNNPLSTIKGSAVVTDSRRIPTDGH